MQTRWCVWLIALIAILVGCEASASATVLTDTQLDQIRVGGAAFSTCDPDKPKVCADIPCNPDRRAKICFVHWVCTFILSSSSHCANDSDVVNYKMIQYEADGDIRCATVVSECVVMTKGCAGMPKPPGMLECGDPSLFD